MKVKVKRVDYAVPQSQTEQFRFASPWDGLMRFVTNQRGVALIGVLVAVVVLGLMSGIAGSTWQTIVQRAKEQELLWRGGQYRKAIESYYKGVQAGGVAALPRDLDSLVKDPRSAATVRHLRRLYPDPITGEDWVVVKDPAGGITGVRSSSSLEPFKQEGFREENKDFSGKTSYSEWEFVFNVQEAKAETKKTTEPKKTTETEQ